MKHISIFIFFSIFIKTTAQNILVLPENPQPGKHYAQCLVYDSLYQKEALQGVIPPLGWEVVLLEKAPKYAYFELELPIFDTIQLEIPVDKTTRLANIPDEYGLVDDKIMVKLATTQWLIQKETKRCYYKESSDCVALYLSEVPAIYKTVMPFHNS